MLDLVSLERPTRPASTDRAPTADENVAREPSPFREAIDRHREVEGRTENDAPPPSAPDESSADPPRNEDPNAATPASGNEPIVEEPEAYDPTIIETVVPSVESPKPLEERPHECVTLPNCTIGYSPTEHLKTGDDPNDRGPDGHGPIGTEVIVPAEAPVVGQLHAVEGAPPATYQPFATAVETEPEVATPRAQPAEEDTEQPPRPPQSFLQTGNPAPTSEVDAEPIDVGTPVTDGTVPTPGPSSPPPRSGTPRAQRTNRVDSLDPTEGTTSNTNPVAPGSGIDTSSARPVSTPVESNPANPTAVEATTRVEEAAPTTPPTHTAPTGSESRAPTPAAEGVGRESGRNTTVPTSSLENAESVVRGMERSLNTGRSLRIRLDPPELGSLSIEIVRRDGGIVARLEVDNPAAHRAVSEHAASLGEQLARQGHSLDRIDVELGDSSEEERPRDERRENDEREQRQQGRNGRSQDDEPADDVDVQV